MCILNLLNFIFERCQEIHVSIVKLTFDLIIFSLYKDSCVAPEINCQGGWRGRMGGGQGEVKIFVKLFF